MTGVTSFFLHILAMVCMLCDHLWGTIIPGNEWLTCVGRIAFPIFAFMTVEGYFHTANLKKYLLRLLGMGALCQAVYLLAMGSLYQCILITFSLSVISIGLYDAVERENTAGARIRLGLGTGAIFFLCTVLPDLLPHTDFEIDYGLPGVLLPVLIYGAGTPGLLLGVALVALKYGGIQWLGLLAVPLLLTYNGQRGKANLGKLFYWYYPIHLVVIYGISLIL